MLKQLWALKFPKGKEHTKIRDNVKFNQQLFPQSTWVWGGLYIAHVIMILLVHISCVYDLITELFRTNKYRQYRGVSKVKLHK